MSPSPMVCVCGLVRDDSHGMACSCVHVVARFQAFSLRKLSRRGSVCHVGEYMLTQKTKWTVPHYQKRKIQKLGNPKTQKPVISVSKRSIRPQAWGWIPRRSLEIPFENEICDHRPRGRILLRSFETPSENEVSDPRLGLGCLAES